MKATRVVVTALADELDLPGLRHRRVSGFPYLVFYSLDGAAVRVWRVLHEERDIPAHLRGPGRSAR